MTFTKPAAAAANSTSPSAPQGRNIRNASNAVSPRPLRNPYLKNNVEQKSIKSSFTALSDQTTKYKKATQKATADHEQLLRHFKKVQADATMLAKDLRAVQDKKGSLEAQVSLWKRQAEALEQGMLAERQECVHLTQEMHLASAQEKQHRKDFCHKMEALNNQLQNMANHRANRRLLQWIHPKTATLVLNKVQDKVDQSTFQQIQQHFENLEPVAEAHFQVWLENHDLNDSIHLWHRRILQEKPQIDGSKQWTEQDFLALEQQWKNEWKEQSNVQAEASLTPPEQDETMAEDVMELDNVLGGQTAEED